MRVSIVGQRRKRLDIEAKWTKMRDIQLVDLSSGRYG